MSPDEIKKAIKRILAGERATLVVAADKRAEAEKVLAQLPAHLRERLTLTTR